MKAITIYYDESLTEENSTGIYLFGFLEQEIFIAGFTRGRTVPALLTRLSFPMLGRPPILALSQ